MNWWVLGGQTLAAILATTGLSQIVQVVARRRQVRVDAAVKLNDETLEYATQLKQDAADARREAAEARREAADARAEATQAHREMRAIKQEAEALAAYLHRIVAAIYEPHATVDRLRAMVGEPGGNGMPGFGAPGRT